LLQRLLVSGTCSYQVIVLLQLRNAEVGSCIREKDVAATQDAKPRWGWEGEWIWDRRCLRSTLA
jgi:hypothetical protein